MAEVFEHRPRPVGPPRLFPGRFTASKEDHPGHVVDKKQKFQYLCLMKQSPAPALFRRLRGRERPKTLGNGCEGRETGAFDLQKRDSTEGQGTCRKDNLRLPGKGPCFYRCPERGCVLFFRSGSPGRSAHVAPIARITRAIRSRGAKDQRSRTLPTGAI